ncbi:MAG TPA: hypothetical protein VK668_06975 [Mucilaginibacter sp.]|nr:hypothetical protein [Mucilaginibacter sp.]
MKTLTLSVLFTFLVISLKAQQVTNFTGTWKRNTDKCDAGNLSVNSIPISISVEQSKSQIQIKRVSKSAQGDSTAYTEKIKFDDSSVTSGVKPNLNKSATVAWSIDQKQLIETANYTDGQGNPMQKVKENWSLSDDGKTLTIQTIILADGKDYQLTEVFDKK